ncbi:MAG: arylformamidase [Solirubrobacteraceae bacterium]|jgi:kynurenine formamidase|nr:arylformamidase [Solirubrobacteraceae bacterium]
MARLVDLSPTVPHGFRGPPSTDLGVQLAVDVRASAGAYWQSAHASLSCHTGCHVESARHVLEDGETIDAVDLDRVIGPAVVLDLTGVGERGLIDAEDVDRALGALQAPPRPGDVVLLRTDWATRAIGTPEYFRRSPALTEAAARRIVALAPRCVGCDFFEEPAARDPGWAPEAFVVHRVILGAGIPLVEGLVNLGELPARCEFFAPFYKLGGIEAAPARAFARVDAGGVP